MTAAAKERPIRASGRCPHCGGTGRVGDETAIAEALALLQADRRLEVYEAGGPRGEGTGRWLLTYTRDGPQLTTAQVQNLERDGWLKQDAPGLHRQGPKLG